MSTFCYAYLTNRRDAMAPGRSTSNATGIKTYIDAVLALVPAEVLALHAVIVSFTTKVDNKITTITDQATLSYSFYGLIVLTFIIYIFGRLKTKDKSWDKYDYFRMFIPPLAFIGWTMLQTVTAFDAAFPGLAQSARMVIASFLAVLLGIIASYLGSKADQKDPGTMTSST